MSIPYSTESNLLRQFYALSLTTVGFGAYGCLTLYHSGKETIMPRVMNVIFPKNPNRNAGIVSMIATLFFGSSAIWTYISYRSLEHREIQNTDLEKRLLLEHREIQNADLEKGVPQGESKKERRRKSNSTISFNEKSDTQPNYARFKSILDSSKTEVEKESEILKRRLVGTNSELMDQIEASEKLKKKITLLQSQLKTATTKIANETQVRKELEEKIFFLNTELQNAETKVKNTQDSPLLVEQKASTSKEPELLREQIESLKSQLEKVKQNYSASSEDYSKAYNLAKNLESTIENQGAQIKDMKECASIVEKKLEELTKSLGTVHEAIQTISLPATEHPFYQLIKSLNAAIRTQNSHGCERSLQSVNSPHFKRKSKKQTHQLKFTDTPTT